MCVRVCVCLTGHERIEHDEGGGGDHLLQGGLGGDVDATSVVGLEGRAFVEEFGLLAELACGYVCVCVKSV